ncbi:hypothetical protein B0H13DRAFT_1876466 [Mycena leptocephala]|nr:hypothetical protein B0H13DRAFT_1876466 [Mycena leptocephala]
MPLVSCQVTAPMAQVSTSARPPTYEKALALDPRLRLFMDRAPFQYYSNEAGRGMMFPAYILVYMHRGSFVQALKDRPLNPPVCGVVLGRVSWHVDDHGASMVIQSDMRIFSLLPDHFNRWWPIWKSLVNASVGDFRLSVGNSYCLRNSSSNGEEPYVGYGTRSFY